MTVKGTCRVEGDYQKECRGIGGGIGREKIRKKTSSSDNQDAQISQIRYMADKFSR